jgi:hypothetical protein
MSKVSKKIKNFLYKVDEICLNAEKVNPEDCTAIIDHSLGLAFLVYDPEDANFFQEKMKDKWPILKEKSHLKQKDADDIISIIQEQLSKTSHPEEKLSHTYIKHVQNKINKSIESLNNI